jgi:hypothetical protein
MMHYGVVGHLIALATIVRLLHVLADIDEYVILANCMNPNDK